jgi:hypothetical protein
MRVISFQKIAFAEPWDGCTRVYSRSDTPYCAGLVDKMLVGEIGGQSRISAGEIASSVE